MPKISCIMSVYNTEKYLDECIQSILNQTFKDFEFIISDDGSTDWSKEIIKKYATIDKRIVFLDNPKNRWIIANLNDCMDRSKWEFVAIMESDDVSIVDRFYEQTKYLEFNSSIHLVGCRAEIIDQKNNHVAVRKTEIHHEKIKQKYLYEFQFCTPWIMFKKELYYSIWKFSYWVIWDSYFYTYLILNWFIVANIWKILLKKRDIESSTSNKNFINVYIKWARMNIKMLKKHRSYWILNYIKILSRLFFSIFNYITSFLLKKIWLYHFFSRIWRMFF